jgi:LysR family carnitine catabolism transcriptional activator
MSISHHVLPSALVEFRKQHPKMHLHVREGLATGVQEDVRSGLADFGIGNVDALPPGITADSIAEERCYVMLPRRHPLCRKSIVRLKDIVDEPIISMPIGAWLERRIDAVAREEGIVLNNSITAHQFTSKFQFVAAGLGIAIVPAAAIPPAGDYPIIVRPLRPPITRRIGVLRLEDRPLSEASIAFLDIFQPKLLAVIGRRHRRRR